MSGNTRFAGRGKSKYSSYRCSSRVQYQGCENKELRKEYLDNFVLDELYDRLFSDNAVKKLSAMLSEYNQKKTVENNSDLDVFRQQLEETTRKITSIVNLVSESEISINTVKDNLQKLEEQKNLYEIQIKAISDTVKISAINEDTINALIEKSREFIRTKNIPECRNFIENYVEKVLVYNDKVSVIFKINIPDSNQNVVPLTSHENIKVLQREYKDLANAY